MTITEADSYNEESTLANEVLEAAEGDDLIRPMAEPSSPPPGKGDSNPGS